MKKTTAFLMACVAGAALLTPAFARSDDTGPTNAQLEQQIQELQQELQQSEMRQSKDHDYVAAQTTEPGWWNNTTISGRMYFDASYISQDQAGNKDKLTSNGGSFDIKRFYIGIDHKFDDVFSANVTTDFTYDSNAGVDQLYIKKAYLQAKISDAFIIRAGSADLPWVPFVEDLYGYRYIENTLIDRTKFGTSADWGVHFSGKLGDGGMFQYALSVVNGAGYKKANLFRTNQPDVEGRISAKFGNWTVGAGGYYGKLGVQHGTDTFHTASRENLVVAYTTDTVRFGVEYFHANDYLDVTKPTSDNDNGVSVFGSYKFNSEWSVFGRYDWVTPHQTATDSNGVPMTDVKDNYFNVGIQWEPVKIVDLSLVYKRDSIDDGSFGTTNGTIGGTNNTTDGTYDEVGIFGQLRW